MTHMCRESCGVCGFLSTLNEETQNFEGKSYSRIDDANFDCGRYKSFDYLESIGLNVTREDKNEGTTKTPVQPEADDFSNEFDLRNTAGDNDDPNDLSFANSNENAEIFCTASLISDKWMLTAGHCSDRIDNNFGEQKKIQTQTIRSLIPDLKEYVEVRNVYIHPEYRSNELHGDVALLELGRRVEFKPNVYGDTPLCLDNRIPLEGRTATGQGYGLTEDGNQGNLLEANVTIIGTTDCIDELDAYLTDKERKKEKFCETMPLGVSDEQLCVKGIKKGDVITAACKGDSGGPLFLQDDDGLRTLVGIVSGSLSCEGRAPEWYSRIKYFRDWITCIMDRTPADNYNKARVEKACKSAGARKTGGPTSDFCPKNI
jgi:secreted trypsin-like serine protease